MPVITDFYNYEYTTEPHRKTKGSKNNWSQCKKVWFRGEQNTNYYPQRMWVYSAPKKTRKTEKNKEILVIKLPSHKHFKNWLEKKRTGTKTKVVTWKSLEHKTSKGKIKQWQYEIGRINPGSAISHKYKFQKEISETIERKILIKQ